MKKLLALVLGLSLFLTMGMATASAFEFATGSGVQADASADPAQTEATPPPTEPLPTQPPAAVLDPEPQALATQYGMTNTKGVNVRARAKADSDKVTTLAITGTPFVILEEETVGKQVWYKVGLDEETEGYIRGDLVQIATEAEYRAAGGTYFPFPTAQEPAVTTQGTDPNANTQTQTQGNGAAAGQGQTSNNSNKPGSNALNVIPGFGAGPDESADTTDSGNADG